MKNSKKTSIAIASAFFFVLILAALAYASLKFLTGGRDSEENAVSLRLKIEQGDSARKIAALLENEKIIKNKTAFYLLARFPNLGSLVSGQEAKIFCVKAGVCDLKSSMDAGRIYKELSSGREELVSVSIPEGLTISKIAKRLEKALICPAKDFREAAKGMEGFLFPDTYEVEPGTSSEAILQMMVRNFDDKLTDEMRAKAEKLNLSVYELVTLASLVEKEARYEEDRPIIAQVFFKRLEINMPLQSDTTIQYLLDTPKEDVTYADTEIDSPYNTYQHYGLPPGPVANPGLASIEAVLEPADTDYLYFVADRAGHNHYSKSYDDHMEIVNRVR